MDSSKSDTPETYSNLNPAFVSEVNGKLNAHGIRQQSSGTRSHEDAVATLNYDAENHKNEKEARESRALLPFCIVFGFGSLFSSSVQAYMTSQITVIERILGLTSSQSGVLLSANDIGFVATVLVASHFLHRYHIPRILAVCILVFGLSGVLTGLPHFYLQEKMPHFNSSHTNSSDMKNKSVLCIEGTSDFTGKTDCSAHHTGAIETNVDTRWVVIYIAAMMVIQGIAKSSRQPLSITYVDNNAKKERTGFYLGILSTFGIFGPMVAITAGGLFNKLPVDLKETTLQPEDPRWIGAWWLGFIVFGACAVLISFPIFCFPFGRKTPPSISSGKRKKEETETENVEKSCLSNLGDLPRSIIRVFRSPVYTLSLLAILLQMFGIMSLAAFGPKYIENQFRIPTWKANVIIGPEKLVSTVLGTFCGGVLTRRLKLGVTGCLRLAVIVRAISLSLHCFNFLFGCDTPPITGLDAENSISRNLSCNCNGVSYLPVCADGQAYFSPCHAGCQSETPTGFSQCIASNMTDASPGLCDSGCQYLIPFVVTNGIASLIGTLVISPVYVIILRSVKEKDRSMAVGVTSFLMALLVFLPAPIVYGRLFDSLCMMWTNSCGDKGSCLLYDVAGMRLKFTATHIGLSICSVLLTILALVCAGRTTFPQENSTLNHELEIKTTPKQTKNSPNGCGQRPRDINHVTGGSDDGHGYVNVAFDQESPGGRKPLPLPPTPDKPPKPSPRQSRDPVFET